MFKTPGRLSYHVECELMRLKRFLSDKEDLDELSLLGLETATAVLNVVFFVFLFSPFQVFLTRCFSGRLSSSVGKSAGMSKVVRVSLL